MAPKSTLLLFPGVFRSARPAVREFLRETARHALRHEFVNLSAECCYLLHTAGRNEADRGARHHIDRLDLGSEVAVELVHLGLPLEVRDHAEALDDRLRLPAARELDHEL